MTVDLWHDLPSGPDYPNLINAIVEIPKGSRNKYEYSKEHGTLMLDRVLYSSIYYPGDYGFIPRTYFDDDDPMDILVMVNGPTFPGCLIEARPIGMLKLTDRGEPDHKVLSVVADDPTFEGYRTLEDVPPHYLIEVVHFFTNYKVLEGAVIEDYGWAGLEETKEVLEYSVRLYAEKFADRQKALTEGK